MSSDSSVSPVPQCNELESSAVSSQIHSVLKALAGFRTQITTIQNEVRMLEKSFMKELRLAKRNGGKQKKKVTRKPSGFAKPAKISDDLATFMNREKGTEVARTEVTQFLISYIKENACVDSEDKKKIRPDDKLKNLLNVSDNDEVTYFTLQKLMNRHFPSKKLSTQ
jgi:chromatin remodeling complex protein RSC6